MDVVDVNVSVVSPDIKADNLQLVMTFDDMTYTVNCFSYEDGSVWVGGTLFVTRQIGCSRSEFVEDRHKFFHKKVDNLHGALCLVRAWHNEQKLDGSKP